MSEGEERGASDRENRPPLRGGILHTAVARQSFTGRPINPSWRELRFKRRVVLKQAQVGQPQSGGQMCKSVTFPL